MKDIVGMNININDRVVVSVIQNGRPRLCLGTVIRLKPERTEVILALDTLRSISRSPLSVAVV